MSIFDVDLGGLDDRLNLSDNFNSPFDKNAQFMDDHGENVTKAGIIAAILYGAGAGGGMFGGEGGGLFGGGSTSTGGAAGMFGQNASKMFSGLLGNLGGGGGNAAGPQRRRGILGSSFGGGGSSPLFNFGSDSMIDPSTAEMLRRSTFV